MVGFEQQGGSSPKREPEAESSRATRYGWMLFICYAVLYGGFVLINAFAPELMERTPLGGVNLAISYGLLLIAAAFVIALFYDWLCRALVRQNNRNNEPGR